MPGLTEGVAMTPSKMSDKPKDTQSVSEGLTAKYEQVREVETILNVKNNSAGGFGKTNLDKHVATSYNERMVENIDHLQEVETARVMLIVKNPMIGGLGSYCMCKGLATKIMSINIKQCNTIKLQM